MKATLTKRENEDLERIKGSLIIWSGIQSQKVDDVFFSWCKRMYVPYVSVKKHGNFVNISMDLPNVSGLLDTEGVNQLRMVSLSFGAAEAGNNFMNPSMDDIPLDLADDFAGKLVEIGRDYCRRNPLK